MIDLCVYVMVLYILFSSPFSVCSSLIRFCRVFFLSLDVGTVYMPI